MKATCKQQHLSCCTAGWALSTQGPQPWHGTCCLLPGCKQEDTGRRRRRKRGKNDTMKPYYRKPGVPGSAEHWESCLFFLIPGQPDTTCYAFVGETVILPCTTTSPGELNLSKSMLYWQIDSVLVHFFHNGQDSLSYQDERYRGRTSLFLDQMEHGNFSLKLSNVQLLDTDVYTCIYKQTGDHPNETQKSKINLIVSGKIFLIQREGPEGSISCWQTIYDHQLKLLQFLKQIFT